MEVEREESEAGMAGEDEVWMDFNWEDPAGDEIRRKTLVGKIVSERPPNLNIVKNMIHKAWNMQNGLGISEIGENVYRFSFEKEEDCKRVIRGRPWMILGFLLVLEKWKPKLTMHEVELNWSPF